MLTALLLHPQRMRLLRWISTPERFCGVFRKPRTTSGSLCVVKTPVPTAVRTTISDLRRCFELLLMGARFSWQGRTVATCGRTIPTIRGPSFGEHRWLTTPPHSEANSFGAELLT